RGCSRHPGRRPTARSAANGVPRPADGRVPEGVRRRAMDGPLKWHGGKHYLAPKIVALFPPRRSDANPDGYVHYVEPYAGGLAVLLASDPEGVSEVANDLDGGLTNFWRVLQDEAL